jgi:hypothetical protein
MSYKNIITNVVSSKLKNPIVDVLKAIKVEKLLKQSGFIKKEGFAPSVVLLHFISIIVMNSKLSQFIKQSSESYKKDVYYRLLQNKKYNWQKLLLLSSFSMIQKINILKQKKRVRVFIIDDSNEDKTGKKIEGVCDSLRSNKHKRYIRGLNFVSLNYNDGFTNLMLDFSLKFNKKLRVKFDEFKNNFYHTTSAYKRKKEAILPKTRIALNMLKRAVKLGIKADYLLVDSWYAKPRFVKNVKELKLDVIGRITTSPTTWKFTTHKHKTINRIYTVLSKTKALKFSNYNKIRYSYCSIVLNHHIAGAVKVVFIKTKNNLIPIVSTNTQLTNEEIINIYKRRWNIEQGYKELREYFGFGKEENRIYEALIARITLSFISYNIVSYINRMTHEPQTIGGLFKDLECELNTLAISMELFINILNEIAQKVENSKNNEAVNMFLAQLIGSLRITVKNQLDFTCES